MCNEGYTVGGVTHTFESVLDAIGGTPLIRLRRITAGLTTPVYLKAEFLNPGSSVKDRAALGMVLAAERDGSLRPGGVIVEGTSGNTGVGLTLIAAHRGYRAIVVVPDKSSPEKLAALRAYGAEVVVTTSAVPRDDPRHVSQLAARLARETPGGWLADQYDNPANPAAHFDTTGPEIWEQTGGRVTHFVAGIGTGGTVSGTGAYLKKAGGVRIVGADPATSVYGGGDGSPYFVESVGHYLHPQTVEDNWPLSYHRDVLDRIERIGDRESIGTVRALAREEGLLVGGSSGTAVAAALRIARELGPDDLVVVLAPDSGRAYLSKYFDDDWLLRTGFLESPEGPRVADALRSPAAPTAVPSTATVGEARAALGDGPALVVLPRATDATSWSLGDVVGSLTADALAGEPGDAPITAWIRPPLPTVGSGEPVSRVAPGPGPVAVVTDGRIVTVVAREHLG
ncbi:PLP-dependent cysteine synthase family protein [Cryptosporangium japonicum]|uniref:Cystathionine beta-synthase n=1 Tax=Cryptosporangium japonicum TaxID=80872 RepID=A0ABP3DT75_9ACTN